MAIPHVEPGQVVDVQPLGHALSESRTQTLFKTPAMEMIRMVLKAGQEIRAHKAPGEIVVHCLEGQIAFTSSGETKELRAGQLLYLSTGVEHSVHCREDASMLLTIVFT